MSSKPTLSKANPGTLTAGETGFSTGERSWSESFNMVEHAATALRNANHEVQCHEDSWLTLGASGYILQPRLVEAIPQDDGSMQTISTMEVSHPSHLPFPLFEFQHSMGSSIEESAVRGFEQWAAVDLPVFLELPASKPEACMEFMQELASGNGTGSRTRRLLLGPLQYDQAEAVQAATETEHGTACPCCLLFKNVGFFAPLLEGDEFTAIRLYALRSEDGQALADCRVNGVPWQPGREALQRYVASWPGSGFAYRRQYVVAHTKTAVD